MNIATKIKPSEEATDLVAKALENPVALFTDTEKFNDFYARVKAETDKLTPDTSTKKGRDAIRSMASKVITTKTTIEKAGKALTEEWRRQTAEVTASRKVMEDQLAALAAEVRKPLTDWEAAEELRVESCRADIECFKLAAVVTMDDTAATVRERGKEVWEQPIDPARFGDMLDEAVAAKDTAVASLKAALARLTQEEADRAELEKLRAEARAREEADRIAAEQAEAERAEAARIEAEKRRAEEAKAEAERQAQLAEERRVAAEKAEAERIANAERMAAERAQREAEESARAEQDRRDAEHAAALAAERARAEAAEHAAQAERDRIAAEAAEQVKREKNRAHRAQFMGEAKIAIMAAGKDVSEAAAVAIVKAIVAGQVPHVVLEF